jgi:hypothetical protein
MEAKLPKQHPSLIIIEKILKEIYEILRLTLYLTFQVVKENILHLSGIGGILMPLTMMNLAKNRETFIYLKVKPLMIMSP